MRELSLHILDIVQNSLTANASLVQVMVNEDIQNDKLTIIVEDNGKGMDPKTLQNVIDPFYTTRTSRRIGLGIPLLKANAEACNGGLNIESQWGVGTKLIVWFQYSHIDRVPLGNIVLTIITIIQGLKNCDLIYKHQKNNLEIIVDTREIRARLDDVSIDNPVVLDWLKDFLNEQLTSLD